MVETAVEVAIPAIEEGKPIDVVIDDKAKPESKVVTADEGIDDLKAQVDRAKRESAERLAAKDRQIQEAFQRANAAEAREVASKRDHVGTIMEKLAADKDAAKRDLKAAHEAGDFDKVVDAQDRLSAANVRIVEAEKGRLALDEEMRAPQSGRQVEQRQNDPVEAYARSIEGANPRSAQWIRQHPDVVINGSISPRALSAHYAALDEGLQPDSDAYLDRLDAAVTNRRQESQPQRQPNGRDVNRSPTSAPVSRDSVQAPGAQRPGSIRLEPHEVQAAIDQFSPLYPKATRDELLRMYAKTKQDLIAEGKIGRTA